VTAAPLMRDGDLPYAVRLEYLLGQTHPNLPHHRIAEETEHAPTATSTAELIAQEPGQSIRVVVADVLGQGAQFLRAHVLASDAQRGEHAVRGATALRYCVQQHVGQTVALPGAGVRRVLFDALAEPAPTQRSQRFGDGTDTVLVRSGLEHLGNPAVELRALKRLRSPAGELLNQRIKLGRPVGLGAAERSVP